MPITRLKKQELVRELKEKIAKSKAIILVKFHGLSVTKISGLRRKFRADGADYTVAKKTLLKIALKDSGKEVTQDLEGEVGIVTARADELPVFKSAFDFSKKEKWAFEILGGFFEGKFVDAIAAKALGSIPSREILLAQLMNVIQGNTRKLVYVLDQMSKKGQN